MFLIASLSIGSPGFNSHNGISCGQLRVFNYGDGRNYWKKIFSFDGENAGDQLGIAVSISGDGKVVAAVSEWHFIILL